MFKNLAKRALGSGAAFVVMWGVTSSPVPLARQAHGALMGLFRPDYRADELAVALTSLHRFSRGLWSEAPRLLRASVPEAESVPSVTVTSMSQPLGWATEGDQLPMDDQSSGAKARTISPMAGGTLEPVSPLHGTIAGEFGKRLSPVDGKSEVHKGVDIAASPGAEVVASLDGVVAHAGPAGTLGNAVIIDHAGGKRTRYGHLSKVMVGVGDHVSAGQTIGTVGSTGAATGPHLHFEFLEQGKPVNPRAVFAWSGNRT